MFNPELSDFPPFDFAARRQKLWDAIVALGGDSVLVTDEINVRYLSGFSGDSSYLLLTAGRHFILSDSRYDTQIATECPDLELVTRTAASEMKRLLAETLDGSGCEAVVYEADVVSKATFDGWVAEALRVQWLDSSGLVLGLRAVKDATEISIIRRSVEIAQQAFSDWCLELRGDWTERQAAYRLEALIREHGGTDRAFDIIVAGGPRAALPHAGATDQRLDAAPTLLLDWGAKFRGYTSDLTRVVCFEPPSPTLAKIHEIACEAQRLAIENIRPGASLKEVDQIARDYIKSAGYGDYFGHGLGHGFGLQIHESPRLSPIAKGTLVPGMVVTVEPGIYLPGEAGVRIEDDVLVTDTGNEVLSNLSRSLQDNQVKLR